MGGSKVLIVNGGVVYGTSTSKYLQAHKVVVDNGGSFQTLAAGAVGIGIYTNMDARSGFIGMSSMRYVQCTLAKSTPGTLIITNKPYSTGFGYSNATINAGILLLDKSNERTANKLVGPLILAGGSLVNSNGNTINAGAENGITSTSVKPGASAVQVIDASTGSGSIALTAITRNVGGTVDFLASGAGAAIRRPPPTIMASSAAGPPMRAPIGRSALLWPLIRAMPPAPIRRPGPQPTTSV